ncbi:MAG: 3-hydroxyacyl-ACP dehydratase FabZ family protein [Tepidisphaeraceae bacterium]
MPPQFLFDISSLDLNRVLFGQEAIRECNPQRGHMEQLNGIIYVDHPNGNILGFKDVRADEFWVSGHIPGRPLLPGVLMIETAAQLASFYTRRYVGWKGFIGFGGVEDCKFRQQVAPGQRLLILGKQIWHRHRRICCNAQGLVEGNIAFECSIIGTEM